MLAPPHLSCIAIVDDVAAYALKHPPEAVLSVDIGCYDIIANVKAFCCSPLPTEAAISAYFVMTILDDFNSA